MDRKRAARDERATNGVASAAHRPPKRPTRMPRRSWGGTLKRTFKEFQDDNLTDWAAALTYYGILAMFPAVIALISIVGLVGHSATQTLIDNLYKLAPGQGRQIFVSAIEGLQKSRGAAGVRFVSGV